MQDTKKKIKNINKNSKDISVEKENKSINSIVVETEEMGKFTILLTDEQILIAAKSGAEYLDKIKENGLPMDSIDYYLPEEIGTEDLQDGFTDSDIDFSSFFSDVSNNEIDDLIHNASRRESELRAASAAGLVFLSVGLTAALSGEPFIGSVGIAQILEVAGTFFKDTFKKD